MTEPKHPNCKIDSIGFLKTETHPCSYLPERQARSLVAVPAHLVDTETYNVLIRAGFRRSGNIVYRPDCDHCQACQPVRLRVQDLAIDRSQRRALKRHANLEARELPLIFIDEHYALYQRYQKTRHAGGGMDEDDEEQYARFLMQSQVDTRLIEFREDGQLRLVSVIDVLADGLSSVYSFFEPDIPNASFGTFNILWQAATCQQLGLPYLYLGYWIAQSPKMAYKARFQPLEIFNGDRWQASQ
ncbi:MAG: Arginine-tRNA-protein transferase, N-terminal:Arginine-tRNA-protein transferase, C-terminal [Proteobacteria bacterium]|nr:Arginine-tRNA-protein transferase, N-terminal:Arginine-tRNA-protein transferase, C-terminal [Pseudomonadota bacterium]